MRDGWAFRSLGDVCKVIGGGTPSKRNPAFYEGDIPWATVRDMRNEVLSRTEFRISRDAVKSSSTNIIPGHNVVIATRVGLGKVCLLEQDTAINQDLRGIIPKSDNLDVRFLFRWFQSVANVIEEEGTGATVKGVKLPFINSLQIPLPPLPEQKRIVAIIDEAFAGIETTVANTERNLANARELFESYLSQVKGDNKPLGDYVHITTGKLNANAAVENGNYPFFTCSREISRINHYAFDCEAILLAGNNASGDFNVKHYSGKFNAYQRTYVIVIKCIEDLAYRFLYFQLLRSLKQLKEGAVGAGTKFLKLDMIRNLHISIPSISRQYELLDTLGMLEVDASRLESIYQQKLTALAELKQSLLQKAFSGELTASKEAANAIRREAEVA